MSTAETFTHVIRPQRRRAADVTAEMVLGPLGEPRQYEARHLRTEVLSPERVASAMRARPAPTVQVAVPLERPTLTEPGLETRVLSRSKLRLQWRNLKFPALNFRGRR
jgi:hypothetical protein